MKGRRGGRAFRRTHPRTPTLQLFSFGCFTLFWVFLPRPPKTVPPHVANLDRRAPCFSALISREASGRFACSHGEAAGGRDRDRCRRLTPQHPPSRPAPAAPRKPEAARRARCAARPAPRGAAGRFRGRPPQAPVPGGRPPSPGFPATARRWEALHARQAAAGRGEARPGVLGRGG